MLCLLLVNSERSGNRILACLTAWIAKHLKWLLRVNAAESGAGRPWDGKFPGFGIAGGGRIGQAQASLEKLKAQTRNYWRAQTSVKLEDRIAGRQRYIRG